MNTATVTVEDLGDLGLFSLQPERQRNVVGKLTLIGLTRKDVELMLAEAQSTCSDIKIALAILSKLLNGPQTDLLTAVMQLRKREEKKRANPTLNPLYEENEKRVKHIDQVWEEERRQKAAGIAAEIERKKMPWERMRKVD
jgi:hypothetical protein